jgi:hypothetical protein
MPRKKNPSIPGPPIGYVDILDISTVKKIEDDSKKFQYNPLRPSSSGKCSRELGYEFMQYRGYAEYNTEPLAPSTFRLFKLGHSIEYHLIQQLYFCEAFQVRYKQQTVSWEKLHDGSILEGSLDLVFYSEKWKAIADVKSKKDRFSKSFKTDWEADSAKYAEMESVHKMTDTTFWIEDLEAFLEELRDPFFEANFLQLNLYANSDFIKDRGIDHGCILQYNKNDSRLREIRFKPSEKLAQKVIEKFKNVAATIDKDKDPTKLPRDYALGTSKCAFCNFKHVCRTEDTLKPYFRTLPPKRWPKDTSEIDVGKKLEKLYKEYKEHEASETKRKAIEQDMTKLLEEKEIRKVRFSTGEIYDVKFLKTPQPHYELRKGKL